ncbi:regulatory LuxR family protein [Hasllibacter halocynthiae]|uniref:Regulatory LuxR family protein n=1 Tax=Hasllibacter halocynthiae TaxID=595589 RepID=A0A2T0X150_9RHOB|nr:LuxR family transcriptional regulator [Hasllibacter halocynthiae]PRY92672.1 regulatory LuxR family protein [Hasllibacter halocynthiae]
MTERNLTPALEAIGAVRTLDSLREQIVGLRDLLDVAHVTYHSVNSTGRQYAVHTHSPEWQGRYMERGYFKIDPVVLGSFQRFQPADWKSFDWSSRPAREFFRDAVAYGVGNQGMTVPIRGPGGQFALFSVSAQMDDEEWSAWCRTRTGDLIALAHTTNAAALQIEGAAAAPAMQALSPREAETLRLLALGYSRAKAAESLSISEHTIRVYIESARLKLGAQNTIHAVARALSDGHITV